MIDADRQGPFATADLLERLYAMTAPRDVLVWAKGLDGWRPAAEVPELASELPPPSPRPTASPVSPPTPTRPLESMPPRGPVLLPKELLRSLATSGKNIAYPDGTLVVRVAEPAGWRLTELKLWIVGTPSNRSVSARPAPRTANPRSQADVSFSARLDHQWSNNWVSWRLMQAFGVPYAPSGAPVQAQVVEQYSKSNDTTSCPPANVSSTRGQSEALPQTAPPVIRADDQPHSSNPLVLYGRCFRFWTGGLSRREYTNVVLSAVGVALAGAILLTIVFAGRGTTPRQVGLFTRDVLSLAWLVCALPPILGGTIKRLRDASKSVWYMLVFLIPCGGLILVLFLMTEHGRRDELHSFYAGRIGRGGPTRA